MNRGHASALNPVVIPLSGTATGQKILDLYPVMIPLSGTPAGFMVLIPHGGFNLLD